MSINSLSSFGQAIFRNNTLYRSAREQTRHLDEIELNPDKPLDPNEYSSVVSVYTALKRLKKTHSNAQTLAHRIARFVSSIFIFFRIVRSNEDLKHALDDLQMRIEGFAYRRGFKAKKTEDTALIFFLETEVLKFKKASPEVYEPHQLRITKHDERQIRKIARYGELARICLRKPRLLHNLFKMTIRNLYPVSCFFKYPQKSHELYHVHMSQLVSSYHGTKLLKCDKANHSLLLRFDYLDRYVDIMREKEVKVTDTLTVPLETIFEDFHIQGTYLGQYTMFRTGVAKWAIQESWKEYLNESSPLNWYESLPAGLPDRVTFGELQRVFREFKFEEGDWIVSFAASRQSVEPDIINSHGFVRFYIPQGNGIYCVYSPGVFVKDWPKTFWQNLLFIGDTVDAGWTIPDPNHASMPQRSRAELPHFIEKDDIERQRDFQRRLKETFLDPTLTFAWSGDNCAVPAIKLTTQCQRGDLVLTSLSAVKTPPLLWIWTKPYTWAPEFLKPAVIYLVLLSIGGFRKRHGKSLMNSKNGGNFNYPGALHDYIRQCRVIRGRKMEGVISGAHNRDYELINV